MPERLLILNPGSTSTKAAVYDGTRPLFSRSIPPTKKGRARVPTRDGDVDYRVAQGQGLLEQGRVTCPPSPPWWAEAASCPTSWPGATR